jgi:prepilin-type N-terminal cleavage/methylation domain-containing protein
MASKRRVSRVSRAAASPAGFTLIEMMLVMGILALVLVMIAGSFNAVARGKTDGEQRLWAEREGRAIVFEISNDLRGAVQTMNSPSRVLLVGEAHKANGLPLDNLTVSTINISHRRALEGFGAEEVVTYNTAGSSQRRGWFSLFRQRASALVTSSAGLRLPAAAMLCDNLLSLHIRYFDGAQWLESWNSQGLPPGRALPVAATIELTMAGANGAPISFATQVTLPMAINVW